MTNLRNFVMRLWPKPVWARTLVVLVGIGLVGWLGVWTVSRVRTELANRALTKQLMAEEEGENETPIEPRAADIYVNDFKYTANVTVGADGFSAKTLAVKPETKVIFTGGDDKPHRLALAPGSKSPKFFEPKLDLDKHTVFQTKFAEAGTYSFYDSYHPAASLVVIVIPATP